MLKAKLKAYTAALDASHLKRSPKLTQPNALNFSSNDYLGLTQNKNLQAEYQTGFKKYPIGSTGSMLVSGYHETHLALETAFTEALAVDAALLFPSGFAANLSIMQLLAKLDIHACIDKAIHASFYDGLKLSGGAYTRFRLTPQITPDLKDTVIITESIFSMSGQAPNLAELAKKYPSTPLIIDEAHAFGILGPEGLGSVAAHQLTQAEVPLRVIPLGKALGASGAVVAGDKDWITALLQTARPLIYSTAMSPAMAYGMLKAFQQLKRAHAARDTLQKNIQLFKQHIQRSPLIWQDSNTPIQQLKLGCPQKAVSYMHALAKKNIICVAMREPTVRRIDTGLRIVLNSEHTENQIRYLFKSLHQC